MNQLKIWQKSFKGNLCILSSYLAAQKIRVRIVSMTRSRRAQALLVEFPQGYPVAQPGRSQHQFGLAADLSTTPKSALQAAGQLWTQLGGFWGGAADPVHFAFFNPTQWAQILAMCGGKKKQQNVINPYGPINAPTIGFPPGGINIPIPPENPNQPIALPPSPPILPNIVSVAQPVATTLSSTTASRGLVTIQSPVGPAVMVAAPVSTSTVPVSTARSFPPR